MKLNKSMTPAACKSAGKPSSEQLGLVNQFALETLSADQVYVRTAYLAHSGIDRDRDAFEKALLDDFARTLPGKGLFVKHPGSFDGDSGPGIGRWFDAKVIQVSQDEARRLLGEPGLMFADNEDAYLLEASYYIPRSDKNADMITDIDAGVASFVSVGFAAATRTPITEGTGNEVIAYRVHAPGEALEGSLVWLGAQPGARTHKAATRKAGSEPAPVADLPLEKRDLSNPLQNPALNALLPMFVTDGKSTPDPRLALPSPLDNPALKIRQSESDAKPSEPDMSNPLNNPAVG